VLPRVVLWLWLSFRKCLNAFIWEIIKSWFEKSYFCFKENTEERRTHTHTCWHSQKQVKWRLSFSHSILRTFRENNAYVCHSGTLCVHWWKATKVQYQGSLDQILMDKIWVCVWHRERDQHKTHLVSPHSISFPKTQSVFISTDWRKTRLISLSYSTNKHVFAISSKHEEGHCIIVHFPTKVQMNTFKKHANIL